MTSKNGSDIPLGLGMALMQDHDAFLRFQALSAQKQQELIDGTKNIKSRDEMKAYVSSIPSFK